MILRSVFVSIAYSFSLFVSAPALSLVYAQSTYPYVAESIGDSVNVRAGQSANFERVSRLSLGEEVVVLSKEFSWYKIQLPATAKSFVSKEYVQYLGQNAGGITADKVNIRAGAGIHYTVLGQLYRGEQIYILEEFEEWYRIEPVSESYGWVSDQFLKFKSMDLSGFNIARPPRIPLEEEAVEEIVEHNVSEEVNVVEETSETDIWFEPLKMPEPEEAEVQEPEELQEIAAEPQEIFVPEVVVKPSVVKKPKIETKVTRMPIKPKTGGIISAVGTIEPHEDARGNGIYYKIVADGKPVCYVQGVNHMLGRFIHHKVTVDGTVNSKLQDQYSSPVITVVKVRLML